MYMNDQKVLGAPLAPFHRVALSHRELTRRSGTRFETGGISGEHQLSRTDLARPTEVPGSPLSEGLSAQTSISIT
jgi:hypothetical protein